MLVITSYGSTSLVLDINEGETMSQINANIKMSMIIATISQLSCSLLVLRDAHNLFLVSLFGQNT